MTYAIQYTGYGSDGTQSFFDKLKSWWNSQSTVAKVAYVAGAAAVVTVGVMAVRKKKYVANKKRKRKYSSNAGTIPYIDPRSLSPKEADDRLAALAMFGFKDSPVPSPEQLAEMIAFARGLRRFGLPAGASADVEQAKEQARRFLDVTREMAPQTVTVTTGLAAPTAKGKRGKKGAAPVRGEMTFILPPGVSMRPTETQRRQMEQTAKAQREKTELIQRMGPEEYRARMERLRSFLAMTPEQRLAVRLATPESVEADEEFAETIAAGALPAGVSARDAAVARSVARQVQTAMAQQAIRQRMPPVVGAATRVRAAGPVQQGADAPMAVVLAPSRREQAARLEDLAIESVLAGVPYEVAEEPGYASGVRKRKRRKSKRSAIAIDRSVLIAGPTGKLESWGSLYAKGKRAGAKFVKDVVEVQGEGTRIAAEPLPRAALQRDPFDAGRVDAILEAMGRTTSLMLAETPLPQQASAAQFEIRAQGYQRARGGGREFMRGAEQAVSPYAAGARAAGRPVMGQMADERTWQRLFSLGQQSAMDLVKASPPGTRFDTFIMTNVEKFNDPFLAGEMDVLYRAMHPEAPRSIRDPKAEWRDLLALERAVRSGKVTRARTYLTYPEEMRGSIRRRVSPSEIPGAPVKVRFLKNKKRRGTKRR